MRSTRVERRVTVRRTERRDLITRRLCDAVATWFDLHPSELAPLESSTLRRMASQVSALPSAPTAPSEESWRRAMERSALRLDPDARAVHAGGQELLLSGKEFELLSALLSRIGVVHSHVDLMDRLWRSPTDRHRSELFVYIRRLRTKLDTLEMLPFSIRTVRGCGYRIDPVDRRSTPR